MKKNNKRNKNNTITIVLIIILIVCIVLGIKCFKSIMLKQANNKLNDTSIVNNNTDVSNIVDYYNQNNNNVIISNQSLDMLLGMYLEGSSGSLKNKLENYLHQNKSNLYENKFILNRYKYLDSVMLNNSIWHSKPIKDSFKKRVKSDFNADIYNIKFNSAGVNRINKWISHNTKGFAKDTLKTSDLDSVDNVFINALYFDEKWDTGFSSDDIKHSYPFNGTNGIERVDMMMSDVKLDTYSNDKAVAFAYPYQNNLEFIGILPNDNEFNLKDLDINDLLKHKKTVSIKIGIPMFTYQDRIDLSSYLKEEYSELFTEGYLEEIAPEFVTKKLFQDIYMDVNQKGTKAVAISVELSTSWSDVSAGSTIILDRPFVFLIRDKVTNQILFTGRINHIK